MKIGGKNIFDSWKKCLKEILDNGKEHLDHKNRLIREILNMEIQVNNLDDIERVFEVINSLGNFVFPSHEELKNFILSRKSIPGYYYNYGARAFNFSGRNQVDEYIIPLLKSDISSKRAVLVFSNPAEDSYTEKKDTPGLIMIDFKIREGRLHLTCIIRSNNMLYGWPANIFQAITLQQYLLQHLDVKPGTITTFSTSAHLIEEDLEHAKKIIDLK